MGMTRKGLNKFLKKSQAVLEELWGDEVRIDGMYYAAAVSNVSRGGSLGLGGEIPDGSIVVRIRKDVFPGLPAHGKTVLVYSGETWRVDEVQSSPVGAVWVLRCIPASE